MRCLLFLFLVFLASAGLAQSLKDSLFSGKLKVDSALLIKSKANVSNPAADTAARKIPAPDSKPEDDFKTSPANPATPEIKFSDNNRIWKKFVEEFTAAINGEIASSKKIKRGTYTVMLDYEIGTDGVVVVKTISVSPGNDYLSVLVKEKMASLAPRMAPLIRDGVARKSVKRQLFVFTKEKN